MPWTPVQAVKSNHTQSSVPYRLFSEVVTLPDLWDTVGMTNRQSRPQALEDRKIQKLVERLDQKLALQAKGAQIQGQAPTAPSRSKDRD